MAEAYIVEAARTPVGKRGGGLSEANPVDLAAHILNRAVDRAGIDPTEVEDVIFGCVDQAGAQSMNIARNAWLAAGLPEEVPGVTIDRQCGSSQQALHFAAQAIMSGTADLVFAGGVEVMSMVPIMGSLHAGEEAGFGNPWESEGWIRRYGRQEVSQFYGAERIAEKWNFSRDRLEAFALQSHERAARAWDDGRFAAEVVPYGNVVADEGYRRDTSLERMSQLSPLRTNGRITAAVSSQISDGAAALLVASSDACDRYGLRPRARIRSMAVVGSDPIMMLTGPIPATEKALDRASLSIEDIDLFEVNEAFAPVVLAWQSETEADLERVNVNGGAIALGHPLGATGARLMTTLLHELERTEGRFGLQTMCEGGGTANATIIERVR